MANLRILLPEILGSQAGTVSTNSEASASLAAGNLLTPEPWQKWRSTLNSPAAACGFARISGDQPFAMDGVALDGLNLLRATGTASPSGMVSIVTLGEGGTLTFPASTEIVASAIAASSGITGAIGDVNEGSGATDSAYIKPTASSGSYVVFDFGTPAASPRQGTARQAFYLRVKANVDTSGANAWKRPSLIAALYEDVTGTPTHREDLGTKTVHGTDHHLIYFPWNAASLVTASGANVQLRVEFVGENGSSTDAWIDSAWWECESTEITGATNVVYESGWRTVLHEATSGASVDYSTQLAEPNSSWSYKFPAVEDVRRVYFFIRDDHVPFESSSMAARLLQQAPPGYIECGVIAAGLWWSPAINRAQGQFVTATDPSQKYDDEGAGEWGSREEVRDSFRIRLDWLTEAEMAFLRSRLLHEMGTLAPFYIELEPDATIDLGFGGWVTIESVSNPIERRNTDTYLYSMEFTVRVKR